MLCNHTHHYYCLQAYQQEIELREMWYKIDRMSEKLGTAEEWYKQTMEQLNKAEDKLAAMTADWQNTETKRTEVEVELKSLRKNNQQVVICHSSSHSKLQVTRSWKSSVAYSKF